MPANAEDLDAKAPPRLISLSGHGEARAVPDMAVISLGVQASANTAREATSANNEAMTKVLAALKSAGIAEKDIQTSNFSISPRYDNDNDGPSKVIGYDVSNTVTVTVRNLAGLGSVLDTVVSEGSNQMGGIAFDIANRGPVEDEARKIAVADARRKAEIYAAAAGVGLGRIVSITEGVSVPPGPVFRGAMMKADVASAVPVAQGEQTIAVDVNIAWEIN
jgi:uncharacterized protein